MSKYEEEKLIADDKKKANIFVQKELFLVSNN